MVNNLRPLSSLGVVGFEMLSSIITCLAKSVNSFGTEQAQQGLSILHSRADSRSSLVTLHLYNCVPKL